MKIVETFGSRSSEGVTYEVREDDFGSLFCTCPAGLNGINCWHVGKIQGKRMLEEIKQGKNKLAGVVLPDQNQKRKEAQAHFRDSMICNKSWDLNQIGPITFGKILRAYGRQEKIRSL